jgi:acetyl esterase
LVVAPVGTEGPERIARLERLKPRLGVPPEQISPYHHIHAEVPPTIIIHGTADTVVPYESVEEFTAKMKKQDNICKLVGYRNEGHGFFNYGRNENGAYVSAMAELDHFLVDLGWIKKPPEIIKE